MVCDFVKIGKLNDTICFLVNKKSYNVKGIGYSKSFVIKKTNSYELFRFGDFLFIKNILLDNNNFLNQVRFYKNLIKGFCFGYSCHLIITGVGYRFINESDNYILVKAGYSNLVSYDIPDHINILYLTNTEIIINSFDYNLLKLFCLNLKKNRIPDNYKGKGIRFITDIITLKNIKKNL